jgi:hypothetical protein
MRRPRSAKAAARLTVVVVFPLPPLLLDRVIVRTSAIAFDPSHESVEEPVGRDRDAPRGVQQMSGGGVTRARAAFAITLFVRRRRGRVR